MGVIQNALATIKYLLTGTREWTPFTDWGSYLNYDQKVQFDFDVLVNAGLGMFITKGDQEQIDSIYGNYSTLKNLEYSRRSGVLVNGCYYWLYPHVNQAYWIDRYKRAIDRENPDLIYIDWEMTKYLGNDGVWHFVDPYQASDNLLIMCDALITAYPDKPFGIYTRKDCMEVYAKYALAYCDENYDFWMAGWPDYGLEVYELALAELFAGVMKQTLTYDPVTYRWVNILKDGFEPPRLSSKTRVKMWQTTSRALWMYAGKTTPAIHQYDMNFFLGNKTQLLEYAKKTTSGGGETTPPPVEVNMIGLYNHDVPQKARAKGLFLKNDQKMEIPWSNTGLDFVIMPMGGYYWKPPSCIVERDTTFSGRCREVRASGLPVIGRFIINAGAWLKGQLSDYDIGRPMKENKVAMGIIDSWHSDSVTWGWDSVLSGNGVWNDIQAIELYQLEDIGYLDQTVPDLWQQKALEATLHWIYYLQDEGKAPKIPIIIYTHKWFYEFYNKLYCGPDGELQKHKDRVYLHLWEPKRTSTNTFQTLGEIFEFPPEDSFVYSSVPYGYSEQRVLMHEFSYESQKVSYIRDANGVVTPVCLSLWQDTADAMREFLKVAETTPVPPPVQNAYADELKDIVTRLNDMIAKMEA